MSVIRIGDRQVDTDIEIPEESGLCPCGGTIGRLRQFRCDRCNTVEGGHLSGRQRVSRGVNSYRPTQSEITRSEMQGDKIAMYREEY